MCFSSVYGLDLLWDCLYGQFLVAVAMSRMWLELRDYSFFYVGKWSYRDFAFLALYLRDELSKRLLDTPWVFRNSVLDRVWYGSFFLDFIVNLYDAKRRYSSFTLKQVKTEEFKVVVPVYDDILVIEGTLDLHKSGEERIVEAEAIYFTNRKRVELAGRCGFSGPYSVEKCYGSLVEVFDVDIPVVWSSCARDSRKRVYVVCADNLDSLPVLLAKPTFKPRKRLRLKKIISYKFGLVVLVAE